MFCGFRVFRVFCVPSCCVTTMRVGATQVLPAKRSPKFTEEPKELCDLYGLVVSACGFVGFVGFVEVERQRAPSNQLSRKTLTGSTRVACRAGR